MDRMIHPFLSIVICTYHRLDFVKSCVASVLLQLESGMEIIVVDNYGDEQLYAYIRACREKTAAIFYHVEYNKGLSFARNRGYLEANSDWILYLDDDTIAEQGLLSRVKEIVEGNAFDCVGGMYYALYKKKRPNWISGDYGTNKLYSSVLSECPYDIPHGCVVLYRKNCLIRLKGFSPNFGMKGKQFGYAEETELQFRLFEMGGKIAFDPEMKVGHFVHEERLTPLNMIKLNYALGRGHRFNCPIPFWGRLRLLIFSFVGLFIKRIPEALIKIIFLKSYYWQRAILYIFGPTFYHLGRL